MRARTKRRNDIIAICADLHSDSTETPHGIDRNNYEPEDLYDCLMNCMGTEYLSDPEKRLAVVAFEEGADAAKKSVWYK